MELNRTRKWFYILTLLWMLMLLSLGSWWLYLVFKLHRNLGELDLPQLGSQQKFLNMMKWEGSFFFIFLVLLGASLFYIYLRDMRKTKAMQAFFASLTHELKTPLASMRLQAEVIKDLIADESHSHEQLSILAGRLVEDTAKLEIELDKSLQLSRVERDGKLTLGPINLERYLKKSILKLAGDIPVELKISPDAQEILADEPAVHTIFRNLFENTRRHFPASQKILIDCCRVESKVIVTYDDHGTRFAGDERQLGQLFYKYRSSKGTGIGLYLIRSLMLKMQGEFKIHNQDKLRFVLSFQTPATGGDHG